MIIIKRTAVVAGAVLHFIDGVHDYVDLLLFLLGLSLSLSHALTPHVPFFFSAGFFHLVYYLIFQYHIIGVVGMLANLAYTTIVCTVHTLYRFFNFFKQP